MSERRRRSKESVVMDSNSDVKQKTDEIDANSAPRRSSLPPKQNTDSSQAGRRWTLAYTLVGAVLITMALSFISTRKDAFGSVPASYAVCSKTGDIYTVDAARPRVQCLVVHGSRILATGSLEEVRRQWADHKETEHVPALDVKNGLRILFVRPGHIVIPGLADAHAHVLENGFKRQLDLTGSTSVRDVVQRVRQYIISRPDVLNDTTQWIQGMGWDQTKWPGAQFPTASDFDEDPMLRDRPIALRRVDGHAHWVSSKVIELIGKLPEQVDGGIIVRDDEGRATGIFVDNAIALIPEPHWSNRQMLDYFKITMKDALEHGLTSIHDADSDPSMIAFFKQMANENKLPLRLYAMGNANSDVYWGSQIPRLVNYGPGGRLTVRSIKLYADGALGSWGAALLEPYSDKPDTSGLMRSSPQALSDMVQNFWNDGFQVNVHCIGDRANHVILDIFEEMLQGSNVTEHRPRIEHAQVMHPNDLKRIARLGVIPSVQPTHATSDMWYAETRLGPKRIKGAYAYRTLVESSQKQVLPLGSDFPVEGVNPLLGFYAAVSRLSVDGESPHGAGGWYPEERLTRAQALKGMTLDAAYASFAEDDVGSLRAGKRADFVVLDTNIMTVPVDEILNAKVRATVIDGRPAFGHL